MRTLKAGYLFRQPVVGRAEECSPVESGYAFCDANTAECKSLYSCGRESSMGNSEGVNEMPEQEAECDNGDIEVRPRLHETVFNCKRIL